MDPTLGAALILGTLGLVGAILAALIQTDRLILTNFYRWRRRVPGGFVVIINGGSGVGKTTVAWALARRLNIVPVLGTDMIREVLRWTIDEGSPSPSRLLLTSSFLAHQMAGDVPRRDPEGDIVAAYRSQSMQMLGPIVRVINRVRTKRDPMIIEGVNVVASDLFDAIPGDQYNSLLFVNLYLESRDVHLRRLRERGDRAREFPELTDRYVREIRAIRAIDGYLQADAQRCALDEESRASVLSIENSGPLSRTVDQIEGAIRTKVAGLSRHTG